MADVIPTFAKDKRILTIKQTIGVGRRYTTMETFLSQWSLVKQVQALRRPGCTLSSNPLHETPLLRASASGAGHIKRVFPAGL